MTAPEPSTTTTTIRATRRDDWPVVQQIYREGIGTGYATFESEAPGWEQFVYSGVVEHSVYVAAEARGLGVGAVLLRVMAESTERDGIWTSRPAAFPKTKPASNPTSPTATSLSGSGSASPG